MHGVVAAGEVSGDQILAPILRALTANHRLNFSGIAGPAMVEAGVYPLFPMERLSVMGVMEVIPRLPELLSIRRQMSEYLNAARPDIWIGCDAPDFSLPLAAKAKSLGIPAVHVVSPSVWAWRADRIPKIAAQLDLLLCLFPFEPALYKQTGLEAVFIGHPLAQGIEFNPPKEPFRDALGLPKQGQILAILPGSRQSEVSRLLPIFLAAFDRITSKLPAVTGVIPCATASLIQPIKAAIGSRAIRVIEGQSRAAMAASDTVLLASGTAALESVLTGRPTVAAYRMHPMTYSLVKRRLESTYVTLPNHLAGTQMIPELIQGMANPESVAQAVVSKLRERASDQFMRQAKQIHDQLAGPVTERAVEAIGRFL